MAVVGAGPAGSLFSHYLLRMAKTVDLKLDVVIYEPRFFNHSGPAGCNHCGGVVSESLVQHLAIEGINLPAAVVQQGIDSYMLHTQAGNVRIETPLKEKRIAAVYRANGPKGSMMFDSLGLDRHLQEIAVAEGARIERKLVTAIEWDAGHPQVRFADGGAAVHDLVVVASGVNSRLLECIQGLEGKAQTPRTVKTFICEFNLGRETVQQRLGSSMHVFLLDLPRLEFAAMIPKGDFVTVCLLGHEVDERLAADFLGSPPVRACFPEGVVPLHACHCYPRINVRGSARPFADRIVFIGDSGTTRLYKDGIGAAYRTAKAAATTAVFEGVSSEEFERYYLPTCRAIAFDNSIGRVVFFISHLFQKSGFLRRTMLRMTAHEQASPQSPRLMSSVLWDTFTGSAPYKDIFLRTLQPRFVAQLLWNLVAANWPLRRREIAPAELAASTDGTGARP